MSSRAIDRQEAQDEFIFDVTEDILIAMEDAGISKAELARRLNKSKSRVSRMLSGDANMTLRTLATMCFEIGIGLDIRIGNEFSVRDQRSKPGARPDLYSLNEMLFRNADSLVDDGWSSDDGGFEGLVDIGVTHRIAKFKTLVGDAGVSGYQDYNIREPKELCQG